MDRELQSERLSPQFYSADPISVARQLLGKLLVRRLGDRRISGVIVEVEAYLAQGDSASHSYRGKTARNAAMFMPAGTLYVYSIHTRHCLNVVVEPEGTGAAVLIRALEPWEGIDWMRHHRGHQEPLSSGPGRLSQALAIDLTANKADLNRSEEVWIESSPPLVVQRTWVTTASPRIGISTAQGLLYRYFVDGHACVSGLVRLHQQPRPRWRWLDSPTLRQSRGRSDGVDHR